MSPAAASVFLRDLRRTGSGFDWTAYFREREARSVHTLVTDDDPAFRKALQGCGLDRQLCVVPRMRHLPLWGGQQLPVCCEWAHQGVIRLSPPVLALVEHVMDRWNDLVRCVRDPSIPSSTNRLDGMVWPLQTPGTAGPRPEDAAGGTGLPALAGRKPGLKPACQPGPWQRSPACLPKPFSTKVKQCPKAGSTDKSLLIECTMECLQGA